MPRHDPLVPCVPYKASSEVHGANRALRAAAEHLMCIRKTVASNAKVKVMSKKAVLDLLEMAALHMEDEIVL